MANGILSNILGFDPVALQQQRQQQLMAPIQQAQNPYERMGAAIGTALGSSLFNVQDPRLKRASEVTGIYNEVMQNFDVNDPGASYQALAQTLAQAGYGPEATFAAQEAAKFQKTKKPVFANIDPKDYTPESIKTFSQTGDYSSLVAKDKPTAKYVTLSAAEARARGLNPDNVYQMEVGTEKVTQIGQGPAVVFKAPLIGAENEYAKGVGKSRAERDIQQFGAAEAAAENLIKINETLSQLQKGEAITGAFADIQTNIQKVQAKFAADKKAGKRVTDTEYLDALLGSDVFPMISSLGIGARGLDTPAERDYLRQVMTGTIKLEKDTLVKLTQIRKNIAERAIDKFNQRVDKGELADFFKYQGTQSQKFEKPKMPEAPTATQGFSIRRIQ